MGDEGLICLPLMLCAPPFVPILPASGTVPGGSKFAFECPIEGRLGFVTHVSGDPCHAEASGSQHPCAELQPPSGEVCYRRFAQVLPEPLDQHRSRHPHLLGETGNCPGAFRSAMHMRQGRSHRRISRACKPACLLRRQVRHVTAESFHKKRFRQPRQYRIAARPFALASAAENLMEFSSHCPAGSFLIFTLNTGGNPPRKVLHSSKSHTK